jgi:O-antigen/teichoic acid export membrane protein
MRRWTLQASLPLACVAAASIPFFPVLVPWVLGDGYATIVLGAQVMMAGAAVSLTLFYANAFYYAAGRVIVWTKGHAVYTLAVVALSWPVAQAWGFIGVAALTAGGEALFTLAMVAGVALWADGVEPMTAVSEAGARP